MLRNKLPGHPIIPARFVLSFETKEDITFTSISGLEQEIDAAESPDRTAHSTGIAKNVTLTVKCASHDDASISAMYEWYDECWGNVSEGYKKTGTLAFEDNRGIARKVYYLEGAWLKKFADDEAQMEESSKIHETEFSVSVDIVTRKKAPYLSIS